MILVNDLRRVPRATRRREDGRSPPRTPWTNLIPPGWGTWLTIQYILTVFSSVLQLVEEEVGRVSIRKTYEFLRNETQNFSFFAHQFLRKKQQFAQSFASHFAQNCPIPLLRNASFAQFRNFLKIKPLVTTCVFLRIQFWKILFWNVFLLVTFT